MRQPILYAEEMWRNQRKWVLGLLVLGVFFSGFTLYTRHFVFDANVAIWLAYIPCALVFAGVLMYYRWRSRAEVQEQGLRISNLLSSVVLDYDLIRKASVQELKAHFPDARRRYIRPIARPLLERPALFIRLRSDDPRVPELQRRLGKQLMSDDTLALPIPDPDGMQWEITTRLPDKTGVNLGGQRRRKRSRGR